MHIVRTLLFCGLLGSTACDCDSPETAFIIEDEELTDAEWESLEESWGEADTEPSYCRYVCTVVYARIRGETVVQTDSCVLDVEIQDPDTASNPETVEVESVRVTCEGMAVADTCED